MGIDTIVLGVGPHDREWIDRLATATLDVAVPTDARVVILHVFTDAEFDEAVREIDYDAATDVDADDVAAHLSMVRTIITRLESGGVEYGVEGAIGSYGDSIVEVAERTDADLVVLGARRHSRAGRSSLGETVETVLESAPCPVTVVRQD